MNPKELYEQAIYMERDGRHDKAKELYLAAVENGYYPGLIRLADLLKAEGKQKEAQDLYEKAYFYNGDPIVRFMLEERGKFPNRGINRKLGESTPLSTLMGAMVFCMIAQIIINLLILLYTLDKGSPILLWQLVVNLFILFFNISVFHQIGRFSINMEDYKFINDKKRKELAETVRKLEQRISNLEHNSVSQENEGNK